MLIPVLFMVTIVTSSLLYFAPGDPVRVMLGLRANVETVERIRSEMGLDKPIYMRYLLWLGHAVRGDLGLSLQRGETVSSMILERLPATLELACLGLTLAIALAIPIGVISGARPYTVFDNGVSFLSIFWISMPGFWLAMMAILVFSIKLHIFPISGRGGSIWHMAGIKHLALPALILGLRQVAIISRLVRSGMIEELNEDYIQTARSKGLTERLVIYKHALRNALIPTVTMIGLQIPEIISVTVVLEVVFAWPGMGRLLVDGVFKRDYTLVQGAVFVFSFLVVFINLAADILYAYIDPRIKYE